MFGAFWVDRVVCRPNFCWTQLGSSHTEVITSSHLRLHLGTLKVYATQVTSVISYVRHAYLTHGLDFVYVQVIFRFGAPKAEAARYTDASVAIQIEKYPTCVVAVVHACMCVYLRVQERACVPALRVCAACAACVGVHFSNLIISDRCPLMKILQSRSC